MLLLQQLALIRSHYVLRYERLRGCLRSCPLQRRTWSYWWLLGYHYRLWRTHFQFSSCPVQVDGYLRKLGRRGLLVNFHSLVVLFCPLSCLVIAFCVFSVHHVGRLALQLRKLLLERLGSVSLSVVLGAASVSQRLLVKSLHWGWNLVLNWFARSSRGGSGWWKASRTAVTSCSSWKSCLRAFAIDGHGTASHTGGWLVQGNRLVHWGVCNRCIATHWWFSSRRLDWPWEGHSWDGPSSLELNLQLALFNIFQVVNHNSTGICSNCDGASISTELDVQHVLSPWQGHLLVLISVCRAVLVDVYFLYFFAYVYIEELNPVIHTTTSQKQVINLGKSNARARLARVSVEDELATSLGCLSLGLLEDAWDIPDDHMAILVSRCKNVPLYNWKLDLGDFASLTGVRFKVTQLDLTCTNILTGEVLQLAIEWCPIWVLQVAQGDLSILVACRYHSVVCVEGNTSWDAPWLLVNLIELLWHHVND